MKRRVWASLLLWLALAASLTGQSFVVGVGTNSTTWAPCNASYDHGWSRMIYSRSELVGAGLESIPMVIERIGFYLVDTPPPRDMYGQTIELRNTFRGSVLDPEDDTNIWTTGYYGNVYFHSSGWKMVELSTPLTLNTGDHLEVRWTNNMIYGGFPINGLYFSCTETDVYMTQYDHWDGYSHTPNPHNTYFRPDICFEGYYDIDTLDPPDLTLWDDGWLSWNPVLNATWYHIYAGEDPEGWFFLQDTISETWWYDWDFPQERRFYLVVSSNDAPNKRLNIIRKR